jgi:hypothetical protein
MKVKRSAPLIELDLEDRKILEKMERAATRLTGQTFNLLTGYRTVENGQVVDGSANTFGRRILMNRLLSIEKDAQSLYTQAQEMKQQVKETK